MNLNDSDFELFDVPAAFEQDRAALDARWKALQREAHPDRFAAQGKAAQRLAMQWSVRINEAYQRLKDPVRRASYLCELRGAAIDAERNTAMPPEFLMQQMSWRDRLDEADDVAEVQAVAVEMDESREAAIDRLAALLDAADTVTEAKNALEAAQVVRALMFIDRFARDVEVRAAGLDSPALGQ